MTPSNIKHQTSNILILLILAAGLVACRPKGILHSWEMRDVIVDLHKTDALMQVTGISSNNKEVRSIYYAQVLQEHGITQAEFDSSLVWYTAHPQLFDKIYPRVLAQLDKEEAAFLKAHPELESTEPMEQTHEPVPVFTRTELDSVLWVTQHGYDNSWEYWQRPFSMHDLVD